MDSKIIALGAVVVIVVAAIGGGVYMLANNNKGDKIEIEEPTLLVYGNANGDYYLNQDDVTELKALMEKKSDDWRKDAPFADTNCDGSLTDDDVTMLENILKADKDHPVKINVLSYSLETPYISQVRYPVTKAASSVNQTTIATLKTLGVDDEIVATSYYYEKDDKADPKNYDKYVFKDYFDVMDSAHKIGASNTAVNYATLGAVVLATGCTVYIYGSSQAALTDYTKHTSEIDFVQVADGMANSTDYGSAVLLLGFLFGIDGSDYVEKSVKIVNWFIDFEKELKEGVKKVSKSDRVTGVASSMSGYVAIKGSSNTSVIEEAGVDCPVADMMPSSATSSTKTFDYKTDTWLNAYTLDTVVILQGSKGWSWFDGDYDTEKLPAAYASHIKSFQTLECYKNGKIIVVSTMMCGPQKSGAIAQYYYADKLGENWFNDKMTDFYTSYWGFTAEECAKLKFVLTQEEVLGTE